MVPQKERERERRERKQTDLESALTFHGDENRTFFSVGVLGVDG
jgi:hypothetical protein